MKLTHLSLFSGIGGLDLAAEWAGFETVGQCEWADYPTKVLEKHWPDVQRWRDVHDLRADEFIRRTGKDTVTVISGGFPCQPHSLAGKRKASADERDLWPEYRRIVSEIRPKWVVAENVRGLLTSEDGRFFRGILRDFADMGFDVGWGTYPAYPIGAPFSRDRIFIIASANGNRLERNREGFFEADETNKFTIAPSEAVNAAIGLWNKQAPGSGYIRADDGVRNWMDRLKCLGNSVVPQQAYPIFKAIADIERRTHDTYRSHEKT